MTRDEMLTELSVLYERFKNGMGWRDGNYEEALDMAIEILEAEQTSPSNSEKPNNCEPQTESLEQFRVGLEYHTDATHFGKAKGESVATNKIEDEPQTDNGIGCSKCKSRFWCMDRDMPHAVHCNNYGKDEPQTERSE